MNITIKSSPSGDWTILAVNGQTYHEGHDIPAHVWISFLRDCFESDVEEIECGFD